MAIPQKPVVNKEKLKEYLETKWHPINCRQCEQAAWVLPDKIFQLVEYQSNFLPPGSPILPVIPITCSNCGNTILINALVASVLESQQEGERNG